MFSQYLHANSVRGHDGKKAGAGGVVVPVSPVEELFGGLWWTRCSRSNPVMRKTICWSSSGPVSRSIYTLLNQMCLFDAPPPPLL